MNYLEWINQCTPTRWWHDSGNPDEIELALKRGATGVTTNPVLTFRSFQSQPDFWNPKVLALGDDFPTLEAHAEALLKLVATYAADKVRDIYEKTNGADGYALGQLNPGRAGDAEGMLAQARRVHSWAPNIAVKLPATAAGIEVIEHLAEEGIPICATINVSVAQAIAVAEAYARGKEKAIANGVKPPLCIVVQQVGRLDDYLRDVAQDMKLGLDESVITMAGLAVAKRSYHILQEMKSDAIIMPAGLRGAYHLTEMAGGRLLYTINTRVQDMILEAVLIQTGGHGGVGGSQLLGQGELSVIHSLQHQQGCHDFGEAGGIHLLMLVFGIDHITGIGVHQQCCLGGDAGVRRSFGLCFRCGGQGGGKEGDDQCAQQKNREKASCFHVVLLQIMI